MGYIRRFKKMGRKRYGFIELNYSCSGPTRINSIAGVGYNCDSDYPESVETVMIAFETDDVSVQAMNARHLLATCLALWDSLGWAADPV